MRRQAIWFVLVLLLASACVADAKLDKPQNLRELNETNATLDWVWDEVDGAVAYDVYVQVKAPKGGGWVTIGKRRQLGTYIGITMTGHPEGALAKIVVQAVDENGKAWAPAKRTDRSRYEP